jgi:hypothetical protein
MGPLMALLVLLSFGLGAAVGFVGGRAPADHASRELGSAAAHIERRLAVGGEGFGFVVVSKAWLYARSHPQQSSSLGDSPDRRFIRGVFSRGAAGPGGFWSEIRGGIEPGDRVDFSRGFPLYRTLEREGRLWRNDADSGWYETDVLPGLGMDPISARRLPYLLRRLDGVRELGAQGDLRHFGGLADPVDYPGVVVSDGLSFTSAPVDIEAWVDSAGRLGRLFARARNLNEVRGDLVIEVQVFFDYASPVVFPEPSPLATSVPEGSR